MSRIISTSCVELLHVDRTERHAAALLEPFGLSHELVGELHFVAVDVVSEKILRFGEAPVFDELARNKADCKSS